MKIIVSEEVRKDVVEVMSGMFSEKIREQKLSGMSGNMTVVISDQDPGVYLESYDFKDLGISDSVIPQEYRNDKVYLVAEMLL